MSKSIYGSPYMHEKENEIKLQKQKEALFNLIELQRHDQSRIVVDAFRYNILLEAYDLVCEELSELKKQTVGAGL